MDVGKGDLWTQWFVLMIGSMINMDQEPSIPCIQAFFDRWSDAKTVALEKLAKEAADEISELFKFEEWRLLQEFIDRVYLFGTLMNNPSLLDELRRCFQLP
ncbi:MAG: hypothetical protein ACFFCZ_27155 [Promethearchaeota archaeon]